jgi:hypothetical protein
MCLHSSLNKEHLTTPSHCSTDLTVGAQAVHVLFVPGLCSGLMPGLCFVPYCRIECCSVLLAAGWHTCDCQPLVSLSCDWHSGGIALCVADVAAAGSRLVTRK